MIYIEPCAGLGNRFIGIACAYYAAKELHSPLTVVWKRESVMGTRASSLIRLPSDIPVIEINQCGYRKGKLDHLKGTVILSALHNKCGLSLSCDDITALYNHGGFENVKALISRQENVYIKATNPFYDLSTVDNPLGFIRPAPAITEKVVATIGSKASSCIGVHVRRTDHLEAIANSPLELFEKRMTEFINADPQTKFYVATDDNSVLNELSAKFPDRIVTLADKCLSRDSEQGIIDAYTEMLCLSRCQRIIGSFNSTFSSMAAAIGNIPLEVMSKTGSE
jgi:hypothetical protein